MTNALSTLLETRDWLMADGATGTNLFNMGLMSGDAPELWNVDETAKITALYKGAADAGSDLFLTNSFGANASRLKLHGAEARVHELNKASAEIGRTVADAADHPVVVAGSVGPTGEIMAPMGSLTHEIAVEMFHEQAEGLKAGGADVLWVETISAAEEFKAAAEAFALADMPWCGTMSFDTAGRTMMGHTSADMVKLVGKLDHQPIAFGANCGVGASDLLRTPELMAEYAVLARDCGTTIIGGCCGTTPDHLRAMRDALETRPKGDAPQLDVIAEKLGGFSSVSDGTDGAGPVASQRRGRRRRG